MYLQETHQALEKALSQLSTLSSAEQKAQAVAAMKEGMTPAQADQLALAQTTKESKGTKEAKVSMCVAERKLHAVDHTCSCSGRACVVCGAPCGAPLPVACAQMQRVVFVCGSEKLQALLA